MIELISTAVATGALDSGNADSALRGGVVAQFLISRVR